MYIGNDLQVAESGNKIIDDISSSFNGSTTSFALTVGGYAPVPFPINTQQIYISVNGVLQEPDPSGSAGFKLLGTNIVFSSAPTSGHAFFGVILSGADYVTVGTEFPAGSATSPSITFGTDSDTGMYSVTSGTMGFTSNGVQTFTLDGDAFRFNDNKKLMCGTGSDLEIYHNGTDSIIDNNTGELKIYASQFTVKSNDGGETQASFVENGAVSLYHNNVVKAATTSGGINVTGTVTDDGATHDGDVTFTGAAANVVWDKSADDLIFNDNSTAAFGTGSDLQIFHNGSSNWIDSVTNAALIVRAGTASLYLQGGDIYIGTEGAGEKYIDCHADGAVELYYNNSKTFETTSGGVTVTGNAVATSKFRGNDDVKVSLGDGEDLKIYHNGSHSRIDNDGTGNLYINAASGETGISIIKNGSIDLYYDNVKKFETNAQGIQVDAYVTLSGTGGFRSDNAVVIEDIGGNVRRAKFHDNGHCEFAYDNTKRLETTSGGAQVTGTLEVTSYISQNDSVWHYWGTGDDCGIMHDGSHMTIRNGTGNMRIEPKSGELGIQCVPDGAVSLYYNNGVRLETTSAGVSVPSGYYLSVPHDSGKIQVGASNDLEFYHDGADSVINNTTGNLYVNAKAGETAMKIVPDGAVELYHNNSKKIETGSDKILFHAHAKVNADATYDLGAGGARWNDLYLSGGLFVGGTGSANELDDYEEGTWEPVVTPATNSFGSITMHGDTGGSYTKIGNSVRIMGCVRWTACDFSSSSGNMQISLPFTAASRSNGDNADTVGPTRTSTWNGSLDPRIVQTKHGNAILHVFGGDKGENTMSVNGEMSTEGAIQFSCVYRTT
jgi:hypothetical protein